MSTTEAPVGVDKARKPKPVPTEIGGTGLKQYGGVIQEEMLRTLQGRDGVATFTEMKNDPVVGAMTLAIDNFVRRVDWEFDPPDDKKKLPGGRKAGTKWADFMHTVVADMSSSWDDTISEIFGMLPYGWSFHEVVPKRRAGPQDTQPGGLPSSDHDDGLIGWRGLPVRSQDSLIRWEFDENDTVLGMHQQLLRGARYIPLARGLLFRTSSAKGNPEGRALALDTPIPTPDGWRTMGDLEVGDPVFGADGRVRYVTWTAEWEDRPCYQITFSDRSTVVADAEHQWVTHTGRERGQRSGGATRTTGEIARTLKSSQGASNHSTPWSAPLQYPRQDLLIDPYVLGQWLGDGTTLAPNITSHMDDVDETVRCIEGAGYPCKVMDAETSKTKGRHIAVYGGLRTQLRVLDLIGNKHVPDAYMRGSIAQRRALLAGLMDADGHVDAGGRCEFVSVLKPLAAAVAELVRSLGCGARLVLRRHATTTPKRRETWAVKFTPANFNPFGLERKRDRCRFARAREAHYFMAVEPVEARRTKCIEVDAPDHLYLAGEAMVPTHNSVLRAAYRPWYYKRRLEEYEAVGIERDLAGLPIGKIPSEYLADDAPANLKAVAAHCLNIVTKVRRNEQEGLLWPSDVHPETKVPMFSLELLTSGGSRQLSITDAINRKNTEIAMTVLADWLLMGHQAVGTQALGGSKIDLFVAALETWTKAVADVFNAHAIPQLMRLNGLDPRLAPSMRPTKVTQVDVTTFITDCAAAVNSTLLQWSDDDEDHLREVADLPPRVDIPEEEQQQEMLPPQEGPPEDVAPGDKEDSQDALEALPSQQAPARRRPAA